MKLGIWECPIGALAAFGMIAGGPSAWAGAPVAIYTFTGGADGNQPIGGLVADPAGNLYGTTGGGGISQNGVVFELSPPATHSGPWTETVLYRFTAGADGFNPSAGMVRDAVGNLYGTTNQGGGLPNGQNFGTVFKLAPPAGGSGPWAFTTIYRFRPRFGVQDGAGPAARLILDASGNLYGTTEGGGLYAGCCGVVFKLTPPLAGADLWTETLLHVFSGYSEGLFPLAGVTFDGAGSLYGTTSQGGLFGGCCGTVFELSPSKSGPWTNTILHRFNERDGRDPRSDLFFDPSGNLYGATAEGDGNGSICSAGCGAAFELSPPSGGVGSWSEQTIYRFPGAFPPSPATIPLAVLYQNGKLYGATQGGKFQPQGGLFALTPSGGKFWNIVTTSFTVNDGAVPESLVADPAVGGTSSFYGVTSTGGLNVNCCGTAFSWTP